MALVGPKVMFAYLESLDDKDHNSFFLLPNYSQVCAEVTFAFCWSCFRARF